MAGHVAAICCANLTGQALVSANSTASPDTALAEAAAAAAGTQCAKLDTRCGLP